MPSATVDSCYDARKKKRKLSKHVHLMGVAGDVSMLVPINDGSLDEIIVWDFGLKLHNLRVLWWMLMTATTSVHHLVTTHIVFCCNHRVHHDACFHSHYCHTFLVD